MRRDACDNTVMSVIFREHEVRFELTSSGAVGQVGAANAGAIIVGEI